MPLYEYECERCGHRFEIIRKFSDVPVETCPSCDGPVRKLQSAPAFQFKGTGWYVTDYAKKDSGGSDRSEKQADSKSDSKSESKSDSKSDSKTESKTESKSEGKTDTKKETKTDSKSGT